MSNDDWPDAFADVSGTRIDTRFTVELTDEGVVIDVYTDTSNPPVVGTWRLYTELDG